MPKRCDERGECVVRTRSGRQWLLVAVSVLLPAIAAQAVTIRVPEDRATIQLALNAAQPGDVVVVAPGVYTEGLRMTKDGVTLRGTRTETERTVLHGPAGIGTPMIFVTGSSATTTSVPTPTTIEGFDFTPTNGGPGPIGINMQGGNLRVRDCQFLGLWGVNGGGLAIHANAPNGLLALEQCQFIGNGLNTPTSATVSTVEFYCPLTIRRCVFRGNRTVSQSGYGVLTSTSAPVTITDSVFAENRGAPASGYVLIALQGSYISNTLFVGNECGTVPLMRVFVTFVPGVNTDFTVDNCILWDNQSTSSQGLIYTHAPTVRRVSHCVLQSEYAGVGNIYADPQFVDAANGDYRLKPTSPCIDAGNNNWLNSTDYLDCAGNPRLLDTAGRPNTGLGSPAFPRAVVDIGPYEFAGEGCTADVNDSGDVTADDLFAYLDRWFAQTGGSCP